MKRLFPIIPLLMAAAPAAAQSDPVASSWGLSPAAASFDRYVYFNPCDQGRKLPIFWGFDTAWNDYANMLRGVRYCGADVVDCARVSFQPWAEITQKGVLPEMLQKNLDARMQTVGLIGRKVDIVLNLDGGENTVKEVYGGYEYENPDDPWWSPKTYIGDVEVQGPKWADLIDATAAAVEAKGYRVITASPLNEPDLELNGTPIELFYQIAKSLKDFDRYPRMKDVRISGGNTLNNDEALRWYEYNKEFLDEGNTHQLAGCFDTYADFFRKVRDDGKYATADELHNVMEAMVGVEYGMQTGIWWGTAERARGEFMKASHGSRLGYAENRAAWSAASVYRSPSGALQAFVGCSERQAKPSSFNFVSADGPFFINGHGPLREYVVNVPGDPAGAYQSELQRNAEAVLDITRGSDIQPLVAGDYVIVNCGSRMSVGIAGGEAVDGAGIVQDASQGASGTTWNVEAVPENWGGDFSYHFIRTGSEGNLKSLDDNNWNLEEGGKVICYGFSGSSVQQWALEYAGEGAFRIRNKYSSLYLTADDSNAGSGICQRSLADSDMQLWRFIPAGAVVEFDSPSVPASLSAKANSASVELSWEASADAQDVAYSIVRADGDSDFFNTVARGVRSTSFLDNSLSGCDSYRYKVMAEDAAGNRSGFSAEAEVSVADVVPGEIARYAFEGNPADEGSNCFDMKVSGNVSYVSGYDEQTRAMVLSSGSWCQLPYSALASDEFSVSLWFRIVSALEGKCLFSTGSGDGHTLAFYPYLDGNAALIAGDGSADCMLSAESPAPKEWTHVAIVASADEMSLFVGGRQALQGDGRTMREALPEVRLLTYLCADTDRGNNLTASVADMRIYNKALSADEVKTLASASGVDATLAAGKEVLGVEYYTPAGCRIPAPAETGICIERTIFSDGTTATRKIAR